MVFWVVICFVVILVLVGGGVVLWIANNGRNGENAQQSRGESEGQGGEPGSPRWKKAVALFDVAVEIATGDKRPGYMDLEILYLTADDMLRYGNALTKRVGSGENGREVFKEIWQSMKLTAKVNMMSGR